MLDKIMILILLILLLYKFYEKFEIIVYKLFN